MIQTIPGVKGYAFNGYLLVSETRCQGSLSLIGDVLERKVNVSTAKSFA